jgi:GMP synthase (glutamine-hydrolysing)
MVLVLDFGSQFTQLIARRIREANVYCEIVPFNADLNKYDRNIVAGYVLSGGPASVTEQSAPRLNRDFFEQKKPILGICYGMQLVADVFGGELVKSDMREYGRATFSTTNSTPLFKGVSKKSQVWMSHGDSITKIPKGFHLTGSSDTLQTAAIANEKDCIYGVQFHPEVYHTTEGKKILHNFLFEVCKLKGDWTTEAFIDESVRKIKVQVGEGQVIVGVSGGIDSTVAALLISKAIGKSLHAVFVNTGLLRKNEFVEVKEILSNFPLSLHAVDASEIFLERLRGVEDPERKRKIIGNAFIDVFEEQAEKIGNIDFLAQGTLYPDVIESVSFKGGPSVSIKSHHNVGGLKERMKLKLVEPLRELFKDEVRELGRKLGVPKEFIGRHPFPGPGLAVRVLGDVTKKRCDILREADAVFINELHRAKIYDDIWQAFAVLLPIRAVGVMGDMRTYENVVVLRAVTSVDGMTADWARIDNDILADISNKIIRNVKGVNRVVYDISSKPPATIEWE